MWGIGLTAAIIALLQLVQPPNFRAACLWLALLVIGLLAMWASA